MYVKGLVTATRIQTAYSTPAIPQLVAHELCCLVRAPSLDIGRCAVLVFQHIMLAGTAVLYITWLCELLSQLMTSSRSTQFFDAIYILEGNVLMCYL